MITFKDNLILLLGHCWCLSYPSITKQYLMYRREAYFRSLEIIGCISVYYIVFLHMRYYSKLYHQPILYWPYTLTFKIQCLPIYCYLATATTRAFQTNVCIMQFATFLRPNPICQRCTIEKINLTIIE